MRFTSLICRIFLTVSLVLADEDQQNPVHYGACLIDEQLYTFEIMLDTGMDWDFGTDIHRLMENKDGLPPDERERRISLHERCLRKYRDRMIQFLRKYNYHTRKVFDVFFSEDKVQDQNHLVTAGRLQDGFVEHANEMKDFLFYEMPRYYHELGKNMSIQFTEAELKRDEKIMSFLQGMSDQDMCKISKKLGIPDETPAPDDT